MINLKTLLEHKRHVIWDWNGTLLNDIDLCVDVIGNILKTHSLPPMDREMYRNTFRFPIIKYYEELGFDFDKVSFEILAKHFVDHYDQAVLKCDLFEGAKDILHDLQSSGIRQSILSAAHQRGLLELMDHHQIRSYFDSVYGLDDHYAASKIDRGRELLKNMGIPKADAILIGDTDHDAEVAEALGIEVILLGDGHQHIERLKKIHPNPLSSRYAATTK